MYDTYRTSGSIGTENRNDTEQGPYTGRETRRECAVGSCGGTRKTDDPERRSYSSHREALGSVQESGNVVRNDAHRRPQAYPRWKKEEDDFLREYYPDHGYDATCTELNNRFNTQRTLRAVKNRVYALGLYLSVDTLHKKQLQHVAQWGKKKQDIGYVNPDTGMIKTKDGWKRLGALLGVPKGFYAVHLDGDKTNNNPENIAVISKKTNMRMTINDFWSEDRDVTKAGILCCKLEEVLEEDK